MGDFQDKVALVTGGGSGIGRAACEAFAREGAKVVVADWDAKGGEETVAALKAAGGTAIFIQTDVSADASVDACFDKILSEYGRLDIAVNNAGIDPEVKLEAEWDIATFDKIIAVNLRGVMLCMKREIEQMLKQGGGKIVNVASLAGLGGLPNKPFYCSAKHGVMGVTKAAGLRYARDKININAVCPGATASAILDSNMAEMPGGAEATMKNNPSQRFAEAWELAEAILFLSSEKANFIVGHPLSVDGGSNAR